MQQLDAKLRPAAASLQTLLASQIYTCSYYFDMFAEDSPYGGETTRINPFAFPAIDGYTIGSGTEIARREVSSELANGVSQYSQQDVRNYWNSDKSATFSVIANKIRSSDQAELFYQWKEARFQRGVDQSGLLLMTKQYGVTNLVTLIGNGYCYAIEGYRSPDFQTVIAFASKLAPEVAKFGKP